MRLRKQKEVQKENEFYMQLLQQALPPEQQMLQRQEREAEEGKIQPHEAVLRYRAEKARTMRQRGIKEVFSSHQFSKYPN